MFIINELHQEKLNSTCQHTSDLIVRISLVMETTIDLCTEELKIRNIERQLQSSLKFSAHFSGLSTQTSGLSFELFVT